MEENKQKILNSDFIVDLCKTILSNTKILDLCKKELKYTYLENAPQKSVFKYIFDTHEVTNTLPSIGMIGQNFSTNQEVINFLASVKKANKVENDQLIISHLEDHIKKIRFQHVLEESVRLFNEGKKENSYSYLQKQSEEIANFSFKKSTYTRLFHDYHQRNDFRLKMADEKEGAAHLEKCPFGIHSLDEATQGGIKKKSSALVMARSGGGKSTMMRWVGLHNARLGQRVVHFQIEGSEQDCLDLYDAGWTGITTEQISLGSIPEASKRKIEKTRRDIVVKGGEIFIYASETFDKMSIEDCREILLDIRQTYGEIDLIIFDYLEIMSIKGQWTGEAGERRRRENLANKVTNIAIEFSAAVLAATQANDIEPKDFNNANFVLTRHNISEFKGALKPFSYFITVNQTDEQAKQGVAVLFMDKCRYHRAGGRFPIYQALDKGRFYDSKKTLDEFYEIAA